MHKYSKDSEQGIYIYFDDNHKLCNEKFAEILGYPSPEDWAKPAKFINTYVAEDSGKTLVSAFQNAIEKAIGSSLEVTWKKKTGEEVKTKVLLVPISFQGHPFALHFITPV